MKLSHHPGGDRLRQGPGKQRFVLMAIEDFEKLSARNPDPRRTYTAGETPPELAEKLIEGLDQIIESDGDDA